MTEYNRFGWQGLPQGGAAGQIVVKQNDGTGQWSNPVVTKLADVKPVAYMTAAELAMLAGGVWPTLMWGGYPSFDLSSTNVTRESVATRVNANGVISIVSANVLRKSYDPITRRWLGYLHEERRTNLFLDSLLDGTNLSTQSVDVTEQEYTVSFYGSGSITFSGAHTGTLSGIGAYPSRVKTTFTPSAGTVVCMVSGDVKFSNFEDGPFATSFIPTADEPETREADIVSMPVDGWYNQVEGTFLLEGQLLPGSVGNHILYIDDGTSSVYQRLYCMGTSTVFAFTNSDGVVLQLSAVSSDPFAIAAAYADANHGAVLNGGDALVDTSSAVPRGLTTLHLSRWGDTSFPNAYLRRLCYFPKGLPVINMKNLASL